MRRLTLPLLGGALLLGACADRDLPTAPAAPAFATTQSASAPVVNSLLDDEATCTEAKCTLRGAIAHAAAGATVTFTPGMAGTITLAHGELVLDQSVTVAGPGADKLSIHGNGASRVVSVTDGAIVTLSGLTITGGMEFSSGGGIRNLGTLTLIDMAVSGNRSAYPSGDGGGIFNLGTLTLRNSTVSGNRAEFVGAGISNAASVTLVNSTVSGNTVGEGSGGGIHNAGTVTLVNSTISSNSASYQGGGILNRSTLLITHSTIAGNSAAYGSGIRNEGEMTLRGTIVSNGPAGGNCSEDEGTLTDAGYNLDDGATCGFSAATSLRNAAPMLGPLADNGGATQTHALLAGSPAIDAGTCTDHDDRTVATDQRGVARPQGARCDIGAFELEQTPPPAWNFSGFLAPLRGGEWNRANAGQTVALKWSLGGDFGLGILQDATSRAIACSSGAPLPGAPVPAASPGQSALSFDAATGTYQFNWKTEKGWRGTCREFSMTLRNGAAQETHTARFDFR